MGAIALHSAQVAHNGKIVIFARIIPLLLQKRIDQLVILFCKSNLPFAQRSELCWLFLLRAAARRVRRQ